MISPPLKDKGQAQGSSSHNKSKRSETLRRQWYIAWKHYTGATLLLTLRCRLSVWLSICPSMAGPPLSPPPNVISGSSGNFKQLSFFGIFFFKICFFFHPKFLVLSLHLLLNLGYFFLLFCCRFWTSNMAESRQKKLKETDHRPDWIWLPNQHGQVLHLQDIPGKCTSWAQLQAKNVMSFLLQEKTLALTVPKRTLELAKHSTAQTGTVVSNIQIIT